VGGGEGEDRVTLQISLLALLESKGKDTFLVTSGCLFLGFVFLSIFLSFFLYFGVSKFKHVLHFYGVELCNILYICMDWVGPHGKMFFWFFFSSRGD
jgi:hypothetical protein